MATLKAMRMLMALFLLNGVIGNPGMVQQDHVHPNAAGAAVIARTIWPYLQPLAVQIAGTATI